MDPQTVFLVRHAESAENVKSLGLINTMNSLMSLQLPSMDNVKKGLSILDFTSTTIDSDVSDAGRQQIDDLAGQVAETGFLVNNDVDLIVHSPLKRAKDTCKGMFGVCCDEGQTESQLVLENGKCIKVLELEDIREKKPTEYLPTQLPYLLERIQGFEDFLGNCDARNVVVVGHSQYFRQMLNLPFKFRNCDVWKTRFSSHVDGGSAVDSDATNATEEAPPLDAELQVQYPEAVAEVLDVTSNNGKWSKYVKVLGTQKATQLDRMPHFSTM